MSLAKKRLRSAIRLSKTMARFYNKSAIWVWAERVERMMVVSYDVLSILPLQYTWSKKKHTGCVCMYDERFYTTIRFLTWQSTKQTKKIHYFTAFSLSDVFFV